MIYSLNKHSLVAITGVVDLLVTQCPCPAWMAGAGETPMPCWVAVTLDTDASLAGLAAWLHPVTQPPSGGALCSPRPQPSCQVLELPVNVQVTQAAMEAASVASA